MATAASTHHTKRGVFSLIPLFFLIACANSFIGDDIVDRRYVTTEINGEKFEISYLINGDPTGQRVILVHGSPGEASDIRSYLYNVPEGMEFIAVDRLGFGETKPGHAVTSLDAQAAALLPLLKTSNGLKPILVGHSLGGPVVTATAINYPDKVGAVIEIASALDPELEELVLIQHAGNVPGLSLLLPSSLRNSSKELVTLKAELEALKPKLSAITQPITIIHAPNDGFVPYANVAYMEAHFTGSKALKVVTLEGKGHTIPWNSGATVIKEIQHLADTLKDRE